MVSDIRAGAATERVAIIKMIQELEDYFLTTYGEEGDDSWMYRWSVTSEIRQLIEKRNSHGSY
jgi:hypothetical protein